MGTNSRTQLLARKRDLFASLHSLERDRAEGDIDTVAYTAARQRYEMDAAAVLERLDALSRDEEGTSSCSPGISFASRRSWLAAGSAALLIGAAIVIFLVSALQQRGSGQSITGAQPGVIATPAVGRESPALLAARREVRAHPRSVDALLALGQAYLNTNVSAADRAFLAAIRLAPNRPEAPTLHALVLASTNRYAAALAALRDVEASHPRYARAWLEDGLIAARRRPGYPRAIAAWKRFLSLQPRGSIAGQVKGFLAALERAERTRR